MKKLKELFKKYNHAWVLLYALIYMPWFTYLERHVTADFYPSKGDEYTVNLKIREKESPLLEINLNVVSRDQAVYICDHWEKKHSDVYSMLIEKLLFDEPNK